MTAAVSHNSTNVRSTHKVPWAIRAGMVAMGALAPPLAARISERLFMTPPRHRSPDRELEALTGAEPLAFPFQGGRLQAWRFGEGPAVLLVHGWGGRGGQMTPLVPALLEKGCSAVTFDAPAHGLSSGWLASAPLFGEAAAEVAARVGARAAIGHSMGAAGLSVALVRGLPLDAAVFVAPPRNPAGFFEAFCRALGLRPGVELAARERLERRVGMPLVEFDMPRMAGKLSTPLLVVHDRDDREIPWTDGAAIAAAWPGARMVTTEGLGHRRILGDPSIAAHAASFVAERLVRCGCGRLASRDSSVGPMCAACDLERELFERPDRAA